MTPKGQTRDPIIFEAPYLRNGARWTHGHYGPPIGTMHLSGTVTEIWRLKKWGHEFDLLGSRDVIGHVTIRLPGSSSYEWSTVTMRPSGKGKGKEK